MCSAVLVLPVWCATGAEGEVGGSGASVLDELRGGAVEAVGVEGGEEGGGFYSDC